MYYEKTKYDMKLQVIDEIKATSLSEVVEKYKLRMKDYGHKVVLTYNQIESPLELIPVQECRGLVILKNGLIPISLGFKKFFNIGEHKAILIKDWSNAIVEEKVDGSLMVLYFDKIIRKWCVSTTGTAEGEGAISQYYGGSNNKTFSELFFELFGDNFKHLNSNFAYSFELCTPYNQVIVYHKEPHLKLLNIRNMKTGTESGEIELNTLSQILSIKRPKTYKFETKQSLEEAVKNLPYDEEGYVVKERVGNEYQRVKIKSPAYVAHHHAKGSTNKESIFEIIMKGEMEEFLAYFPSYKDTFDSVNEIIKGLENLYLRVIDISLTEQFKNIHTNRKELVNILSEENSIVFEMMLKKDFTIPANSKEWLNYVVKQKTIKRLL